MAPSRDVVVVGAGIIGCAVAYELARRGASVGVIDDRGAGLGATQASAGMLAPFNEAPDGGPLLEIAARGLDVFDDFVARLCLDAGLPLNYRRDGTLDVAFDDARLSRLDQTSALLSARGIGAERLDAREVHAYEPALSAAVAGGLLIPTQGFVGATELTQALAAGARRHGAQMVEHGRVTRISAATGELTVFTERGALVADAVVLAAGSWSSQIELDGCQGRIPVAPVRGQLLQLQWSGTPLTRVVWGERCYVVPWRDGTVLVGATVEDAGFDERTTVAGVRELLAAICELAPSAADATFAGARVGLRPAAPDHVPIVGRSAAHPELIYATAHYRNGVLLAPLTALLVADLLLDGRRDPLLDLMTPARFGGF
ncbi:MAG: glycine oxidase ThiO [Vicinamibacterales bacterium]